MNERALEGRTILVVEDEYMLAIDLQQELVDAGAIVVGPAASLAKAIDLIKNTAKLDVAILDVNLGGASVFPAAEILADQGVPFVLATGYDGSIIPQRFKSVPLCEKPLSPDVLARLLTGLVPAP